MSSKPRILIIGARGFLGTHAARAFEPGYEVFRADCLPPEAARDIAIDIGDEASVHSAFGRVGPDAVLLLAAMSDIDRCEAEPVLAHRLNVRGAEYVACACARSGARLLFTSSAAVFDGLKHGYSEDDAPAPLSTYGKSKAQAEAAIRAALPSAIVVRLALVLGFAGRAGTNSLLDNLAEKWKVGRPVTLPTFEYRNPIDVGTLSGLLVELAGREGVEGIYHIGSADSLSRYELGLKLADRMGYPRALVQPQTEPVPGRAPRGLDHYLLIGKIEALSGTPVPSCDRVIERCFGATAKSCS